MAPSRKDAKQDVERDEFMKVMKSRTKKGPSWANEDPQAPEAETKVEEAIEEEVPSKGISDLDWLKKHTSKNVDKVEKVFEQSDDEDEEVWSLRFNYLVAHRLLGRCCRARSSKGSNKRNYIANFTSIPAEPSLQLHRI